MAEQGTAPNQNGTAPREKSAFTGEEGGDERSTPNKDLAASVVIAAISLLAMVLAAQWKVPDTISTAPGFLPFLTGLSLFTMAIGLAVRAIRLGGRLNSAASFFKGIRNFVADEENLRTLALFAIVFVYIILVINVGFDLRYQTGFFVFRFSSFELFSIITLTIILKFFWRATLLRCFLVATVWSVVLASIFRHGFHILLPGSG